MKIRQKLQILGLVLAAAIPMATDASAEETAQQRAKLHKKSHAPAEVGGSDRLSRRERHVIQTRLATVHRATEKKFNQRAFDRDFDRISARFGAVETERAGDSKQETVRDLRTLPSGTRVRDPGTGQVFFIE